MAEICRVCGTEGTTTPCDGAVISVYDGSVRQTFEVIPNIRLSEDGSTYIYYFSYTSYEGTFYFSIFSRDSGANWQFIQDSNQVVGSTAPGVGVAVCAPETGWVSTGALKMSVTGIENRLIPIDSGNPILDCNTSVDVPIVANKLDYSTVLENLKSCFNTKVTAYYNKITGGVPCSDLELTKMELILSLLQKKNCDSRALNCIYNRTSTPGVSFDDIETLPTVSNVLLQPSKIDVLGNFLNYIGYQIIVTRGTEQLTHTITDGEYLIGSATTRFTIYPSVTGTAYSSNTATFVTPTYTPTTYLETFLNFANKYCADCIVSLTATSTVTRGVAPSTVTVNPSTIYLTKEGTATSNVTLLLESEFPINLI